MFSRQKTQRQNPLKDPKTGCLYQLVSPSTDVLVHPCPHHFAVIQAGLGAHIEVPKMVLAAGSPAPAQSVTGMGLQWWKQLWVSLAHTDPSSGLKKLDFSQRMSMLRAKMWGILKDLLKPTMTHAKIKHLWIWKDHLSPLHTNPFFYPFHIVRYLGKGTCCCSQFSALWPCGI